MLVLFLGDERQNSGPTNVNREIIKHKYKRFMVVNYSCKYGKYLEALFKTCVSRIVIISGISKFNYIFLRIAKLMKKKTVYIMHGCAEYEADVDGRDKLGKGIHYEREILKNTDLLLPVSEKYSQWVKARYPQYVEKTKYLQIGIPVVSVKSNATDKKEKYVAAVGGDWPLKKNDVVCAAVERLNGEVHFTVFGTVSNPGCIGDFRYTEWTGNLPYELFIERLKEQQLLVVNSVIESFGVSLMEALACGCSILVSNTVGATGLMKLEEQDIIFNVNDADEIAEKMKHILEHPNNQRIVESIDWDALRYKEVVRRLENLCEDLVKR